MKKITIAILALFSASASAQMSCGQAVDKQNIAFQNGEHLSYSVKYSAAVISASIADVTFKTTEDKAGYKIVSTGKTRDFYSNFFEMEDVYTTWLDKTTLRPIRTTSKIREGSYQYRASFTYDWSKMSVKTFGQNIKRGSTYNKTLTLKPCSYDAVSLFFNLRSTPLDKLKVGSVQSLSLVLESSIRSINYRVVGREDLKIDGLGTFKTIKVACQIATDSDDALKDGSEFFIWLSDDNNRIPIFLETPIRVGSISVTLSSWSGLKHPFTSKLTK